MVRRDVTVTLGDAITAKSESDKTKDSLEQNLNFLTNVIDPMLADWNDSHVIKYLQVSEEITQTIRSVMGNMERISDFCQKEINWIHRYSET